MKDLESHNNPFQYWGVRWVIARVYPVGSKDLIRVMREIANGLENDGIHKDIENLFGEKPRKGLLETWAIKRGADFYFKTNKWFSKNLNRHPNMEIADIVTVLLGLKKPVTADDVSHMLITSRRKYLPRESDREG